ncbi:hypothetical protein QCA50_000574 [Cerrena zonata]|uniref:Uncharacterized protein n=1 Tax=Cerrena zonata TaxID=2478898 RepID=A0AAW0GZW6_9APHY
MPYFPRSPSSVAPPPMPSPQLVPTPLPTPPILPRRRSSRSRLHLPANPAEPPIPPRLIGSPLLRITNSPQSQPCYFTAKAQSELWLDGDEFGINRKENAHLQDIAPPPPASPLTPTGNQKRTFTKPTRRSGSPPPTPKLSSPPPPVPPIPASAFASSGSKRSAVCSTSGNASSHLSIPELVLPSAPPASVEYLQRGFPPLAPRFIAQSWCGRRAGFAAHTDLR